MNDLISTVIVGLAMLQIKHLFADFYFQTEYMWRNKGAYGHLGGLSHGAIHGVLSLPALAWMGLGPAAILGLILAEATVHYHIDWGKDKLVKRFGLSTNSGGFWTLFGVDQCLHQLTYLTMVAIAVSQIA